jgi:hypothetical protein
MNTLQQAAAAWQQAEDYRNASEAKGGDAYYRSMAESAKADAATLAAIAQAEALTRIAEVLEEMLEERAARPVAEHADVTTDTENAWTAEIIMRRLGPAIAPPLFNLETK